MDLNSELMPNEKIKIIKQNKKNSNGPILYLMHQDQRFYDNYCIVYGTEMANRHNQSMAVTHCIHSQPTFKQRAYERHYIFSIRGIQEIQKHLNQNNIEYFETQGDVIKNTINLVKKTKASLLIFDFSPLREPVKWQQQIQQKVDCNIALIDANNIVPVWQIKEKQYSAMTIRGKIHAQLSKYLIDFPKIKKVNKWNNTIKPQKVNYDKIIEQIKKDKIMSQVKEIQWLQPGYNSGMKLMTDFFKNRFKDYAKNRNNYALAPWSGSVLNPFLKFGQISAQRFMLELLKHKNIDKESFESLLEETIVRRELAVNFCYYEKNYDKVSSSPQWAQKYLNNHRKDRREYTYTLKQFENAKTHDEFWNTIQKQLVVLGRIDSFLRMQWAKCILYWSKTPEEALKISIYLNDKYELDGGNSGGYVGCMWSIAGLHDKPALQERVVVGRIRYMSLEQSKKKSNYAIYIQNINEAIKKEEKQQNQ